MATLRIAPLRTLAVVLFAGVLTLSPRAAGVVFAQALTPAEWHQGSALALFGGMTVSDSAQSAVGGSIAWELTPRLSLDAGGRWLGVTGDADTVFGSVGVRYVVTGVRPVTPYVSGGVGLHRASFTPASLPHMPEFYRRRMGGMQAVSRRTFDDFAVRVGAGVEIYLSRHVSIRPEVEVIGVTDRKHLRAVPIAGVHLAYHFESHPITPSRR